MDTNNIMDYLQTKVNVATDVEASALVGMEVVHTAFNTALSLGKGVITDAANGMLTVQFATKSTRFAFPMAFKNGLSPVDSTIKKRLSELEICPPPPPDYSCLNFRLTYDQTHYIADSCAKEVEEIVIPARHQGVPVTFVHGDVFKNIKLKKITIPCSITKIDFPLFLEAPIECIHVDPDNQNYHSKDGVLYSKSGKELIFYPNGKTGVSFVVNNNIEKIGYEAFKNNKTVKELFIGKNVNTIDERALTQCSALELIHVDPGNRNYQSKDGILYSKDGKRLIYVPRKKTTRGLFVVDKMVEEICTRAFFGVEHIKAIYVGKNVKRINEMAFCECRAKRIYISAETSPQTTLAYDSTTYSEYKLNNTFPGFPQEYLSEHEFFNCPTTYTIKDKEIFGCNYFDDGPYYTNAVIGGQAGSKIEAYCNKRDIKFIAVEDNKEAIKSFFISPLDELTERVAAERDNETEFVVTNETDGYQASFKNGTLTFTALRPGACIKKTAEYIAPYRREKVKEIIIGEGIEKILSGAFDGKYYNLEQFFIGKDVRRIATEIFECHHYDSGHNFEKFTSITVDEENECYKSVDGVLYTRDMQMLIKYPQNRPSFYYEVNCNIAPYAFECAKNLRCIRIGGKCESVGEKAFFEIHQYLHIWFDKCVTQFEDDFPICTIHKAYEPPRRNDLVIGGYKDSYVHEQCKVIGVYFLPIEEESEIQKFMTYPFAEGEWEDYSYGSGTWLKDPYYRECQKLNIIGSDGYIHQVGEHGEELALPEGAKYIHSLDLKGVNRLVIPKTMVNLATWFECPAPELQEIVVAEGNERYKIIEGHLYSTDGMLLTYLPAAAKQAGVLPEGTLSISAYAFNLLEKPLETLYVPASVTNIEVRGCYRQNDQRFYSVDVSPENTTYTNIDGNLFSRDGKTLICAKVSSGIFTVPDGTEIIGEHSCIGLPQETMIVIPESVKEIKGYLWKDIIRAAKGSYAEQYARKHNIDIEFI